MIVAENVIKNNVKQDNAAAANAPILEQSASSPASSAIKANPKSII